MTIATKIQIAEISQYLAAADNANGGLFGGQLNPLLPIQLYIERKAVQFRYNYEGVAAAVRASGTITVDSLETEGTVYSFTFSDAQIGDINLGIYVQANTDTDTTILATSLTTALNQNIYGYDFTSNENVIRCLAPLRLGALGNGALLDCQITPPVVVLETVTTPDVSAAPLSSDAIMYILKVTNNLPTAIEVDELLSYVRGTHIAGDFFGLALWFNDAPTLSGATFITSVTPVDSNLTQYTFTISQAVDANSVGYFILVLPVEVTGVAGRTGYIDGSVDPVQLTLLDDPTQDNQQSSSSGVVTIS